MVSKLAISFIASMTVSAAVAETAESDGMRANFFAESVWEYVSETCVEATQTNDEINSELYAALANSLSDESSAISSMVEAIGKNVMATQMTDLDKSGMAMVMIGAHGVLTQLEFQTAVADEDHLASTDYLEEEDKLRDRALASLAFMECLWPSADDIMNPIGQSGWGAGGNEMWHDAAKSIYTSECDIAFLEMSRLFLEANFADVPPVDRQTFFEALLEAHEPRATPESVAERCEDFS